MPTIKEMLEYLMDHNFMQDQEITILVGIQRRDSSGIRRS